MTSRDIASTRIVSPLVVPARIWTLRRFLSGDAFVAYVLMLPAASLFALFYIWPFAIGFWLSLHDWDGFSNPTWAGLDNYVRLLHDRIFLGALRNNLVFVASVLVLKNVLGLALALLLNRAIFGRAAISRGRVYSGDNVIYCRWTSVVVDLQSSIRAVKCGTGLGRPWHAEAILARRRSNSPLFYYRRRCLEMARFSRRYLSCRPADNTSRAL